MKKIPQPNRRYYFTELPHISVVATECHISRADAETVRELTNGGRPHIPNEFDLFHPLNQIHMLVKQIRGRSSHANEADKYVKEGFGATQKLSIHKELNKTTNHLLSNLLSVDTDIFNDWRADGNFGGYGEQPPQSECLIKLIELLTMLEQTTKNCSAKDKKELYRTTGSENMKLGIDAVVPQLAKLYEEATGKSLSKGTDVNASPAERFFESSLALMEFDANNEFCRKQIRAINKAKTAKK
jgi:hypothetical protein